MTNARELEGVAKIKVIGVGGGGSNAVSRMFRERVPGVEYVVMNTDVQALMRSDVPTRIRIGEQLTQGMGVGGDPDKGAASAEESREEIYDIIRDSNMIFVAAGMGGGTGTGAAPVIADIARETGALTVGVVTRPFSFEGIRRSKQAQTGIDRLQENVDTLLVIPNERLSVISKEEITAENAFKMADDVLRMGVQSITELITSAGDINLDFADVQQIMREAGPAWMSIGWGSGESRARDAAQQAITNPLMDVSIEGATGVIFSVTGGSDLKLNELHLAAEVIQRVVDPEANIIFGMTTDPKMENEIKLTVIATGFPTTESMTKKAIDKTSAAAASVEGDEDSLDLPPFLRRTLGGFYIGKSPDNNTN
jgi:cell division protein FtsZ